MDEESFQSEKDLIQAYETNLLQQKEPAPQKAIQKASRDIKKGFYRRLRKTFKLASKEEMGENAAFQKALESTTREKPASQVELRMQQSTALALHCLLTSNMLEEACQKTALQDPNTDPSEIKAQVAHKFVTRIRKRNQEKAAKTNPYLPDVGLEMEYLLSKLPSFSQLLIGKLIKNPDGQLLSQPVSIIIGDPKANQPNVDKNPYATEYKYPHAEIMVWGKNKEPQEEDKSQPSVDPSDFLSADANLTSKVLPVSHYSEIPIFRHVGEYVFAPSFSRKTQLRDVLHLLKGSFSESKVKTGFHLTIGGVDLDRDKTEMQVLILLLASEQPEMISRKPLKKYRVLTEKHKKYLFIRKPREREENYYYFPFLAKRGSFQLVGEKYDTAVEIRSLCSPEKFSELARFVYTAQILGAAIKAHQKPIEERDENEKNLAQVWTKTERELVQLLAENGIPFPKEALSGSLVTKSKKTKPIFEALLSRTICLCQEIPSFQRDLQKIIISARREIKQTIET